MVALYKRTTKRLTLTSRMQQQFFDDVQDLLQCWAFPGRSGTISAAGKRLQMDEVCTTEVAFTAGRVSVREMDRLFTFTQDCSTFQSLLSHLSPKGSQDVFTQEKHQLLHRSCADAYCKCVPSKHQPGLHWPFTVCFLDPHSWSAHQLLTLLNCLLQTCWKRAIYAQ